ncbi:serine hydrolase FSH [Pseudomassariella vexata]|uniref:Serine hydrolase FSH n=1 Tax=Pseudomassariella vexata TaxID=1141098 RepID=A0A1Y2EAP3_9PEZI|nr:serine hydrolase FSH [Pseudomassariella vexata]ORY68326.1 serine hydrolase FSH [Pseudomassariella vexata]
MRFLCLPGAYGSAKNFSVQLGPFAKYMEERGLATFTFTQGEHEVDPPIGWEHYFGARPLYRFLDAKEGDAFETLRRVRHLPRGLTPEATLRLFKDNDLSGFPPDRLTTAINCVSQAIDEDPEIDALIGYSEGAMLAASLLYQENKNWEEKGIPRRIKFAIFFSGAPPLVPNGEGVASQLADEVGTVIDIPTYHVFGSNDPLVYSSVALYNVCNQDAAGLYDHGLGHLVPRDSENVKQLGELLHDTIVTINKKSTAGTDTPYSLTSSQKRGAGRWIRHGDGLGGFGG